MSMFNKSGRVLSARAKQQRKLQRQIGIGVVATCVVTVATAVAFEKMTDPPVGCSSLKEPTETAEKPISLTVELLGNTEEDASAVSTFVADQLNAITRDVKTSYSVSVSMVAAGEPVSITGCLANDRLIASPEGDLEVLNDDGTSTKTLDRVGATLAEVRAEQVEWIAAEAGEQVRQVDFNGAEPAEPKLSPRLAWTTALDSDDADQIIAVYSPMISTVQDCFANPVASTAITTAQAAVSMSKSSKAIQRQAAEQVSDCLAFRQIAKSKAMSTVIVVAPDGLSPAQRQVADATAQELCRQATRDNCSAGRMGGEDN